MKSVAVIVPTTGANTLPKLLESIFLQSYENVIPIVVVDGKEYLNSVMDAIYSTNTSEKYKKIVEDNLVVLKENTGANGFYGQRIMAAFAYLVNQDYVLYIDQDNWIERDHIETCVEKLESKNYDWVYSLRNIYSKGESFLLKDDCESLGKWNPFVNYQFVDNNCYFFKRETLITIAPFLYGGWGQDRVLYNGLIQYFQHFGCTGRYSVNYRLDGNAGSVKLEFFEYGNKVVAGKYMGSEYPWRL